MRFLALVVLLFSLIPVHAQDDPCTRENVLSTFAEATDMKSWSAQFSGCPSQIRRAARMLSTGFQLLDSEYLPFAAADDPYAFNAIWKWYQGSSGSAVHNIDAENNVLTLLADSMTQQANEITTAPVLAYVTGGNVSARVKLTFDALDEKNGAGLGIRDAKDPTTWIRIGIVGDNIEVTANNRGTTAVVESLPYEGESDVYLLIEQDGSLFDLSYSVNGDDWQTVVTDYSLALPADTEVFLTTFWPVEAGAGAAAFSEMKVDEF